MSDERAGQGDEPDGLAGVVNRVSACWARVARGGLPSLVTTKLRSSSDPNALGLLPP